jgi:predicted Zn-ribbon and HTH transcriptional regulator
MGMAGELRLPVLKCSRCGHSWYPRRPVQPTICPKCKSPYWNKARRKA